jgi:SsrA-binding protein
MSIIDNRKAFHDYFIEDRFEAGLVLEGWEVKSIRDGRVQLKESHIIVRDAELFIIGMHVSPLPTASTHIHPDSTRTRKLLLNAEEISKLIGKVEQRGYTLVPLNLHYKNGRIKLDMALARGKKLHDKRDTSRERDWQREKDRIMKHDTRNK